MAVTWWMHDGYAWLSNDVAPTTTSTRLPMLLAMTCFLVMAIAIPDVFAGSGLAYGGAYLVVVVVHTFSFARSTLGTSAAAIRDIMPTNLSVAGLVAVSLLGEVAFRRILYFGGGARHTAAAVSCLAVAPLGAGINGAIQLLALVIVRVGLLLALASRGRRAGPGLKLGRQGTRSA